MYTYVSCFGSLTSAFWYGMLMFLLADLHRDKQNKQCVEGENV